ncbi:MAG: amidohydrolase family protein, partial [Clostridiales bacterium]|nr:amidohydrolase family protein [Clostridiales bacterium]
AIFKDDSKGYLKKGYLADIVIISEDIFKMDKKDISEAKVTMTIKSGKKVYKDKEYYA